MFFLVVVSEARVKNHESCESVTKRITIRDGTKGMLNEKGEGEKNGKMCGTEICDQAVKACNEVGPMKMDCEDAWIVQIK